MLLVISSANASPIQSSPGALEAFSNGITTTNRLVTGSSAGNPCDGAEAFCCGKRNNGESATVRRRQNELRVRINVP